jgi:uncharacterized membrane protein YtjA (UPF0391 family)
MLKFATVLFALALIAALFGFAGLTLGSATAAKVLFLLLLLGAAVTFLKSPVIAFLMSLRERTRT